MPLFLEALMPAMLFCIIIICQPPSNINAAISARFHMKAELLPFYTNSFLMFIISTKPSLYIRAFWRFFHRLSHKKAPPDSTPGIPDRSEFFHSDRRVDDDIQRSTGMKISRFPYVSFLMSISIICQKGSRILQNLKMSVF